MNAVKACEAGKFKLMNVINMTAKVIKPMIKPIRRSAAMKTIVPRVRMNRITSVKPIPKFPAMKLAADKALLTTKRINLPHHLEIEMF